jgi:hypothetical protein
MMPRIKKCILSCLMLTLGASGLVSDGSFQNRTRTSDWEDIERRLADLRPEKPMEYFELGEDVADLAETAEQREIATQLFALAGLLDTVRLGRGACLALADLAREPNEKRRYLALAAALGQLGQSAMLDPGMPTSHEALSSSSAVDAVVEAFSFYRRGEGSRALSSLREPGAMDLLELIGNYLPGGKKRFLADCRHYGGRVGPSLTEAETTRMLRLEVALLAGEQRPWSGDLLLHRARPLIEVDPHHPEETLEMDPARPFYRRGRWVSDAD